MIEEATAFAIKAHEGQLRKGTKRPYITHPMEVAEIVATMTQDEEIICAAMLHDTIEDCDGVTEEVLRAAFGDRVAELVYGESEDKSKSWMERKSDTIEQLKKDPEDLQMIALADKLANLRDIDRDYREVGEKLWLRFRIKSKEAIGWYYKGIKESLQRRFEGTEPFEEYCALVDKCFGKSPANQEWKKKIN